MLVRQLTLTISSDGFIRPFLKLKSADCLFHFHKVIVVSELVSGRSIGAHHRDGRKRQSHHAERHSGDTLIDL